MAEQKEAARLRRAAELEQAAREQERQAAAEAAEAAAAQAAAARAAERQDAMRREALAREEATLQLSEDALALMKGHKRSACVAALTDMGFPAERAEAAADAAGCEPAAAASVLMEGGLSGGGATAVSVIRQGRAGHAGRAALLRLLLLPLRLLLLPPLPPAPLPLCLPELPSAARREARELLAEGAKLGLTPPAVEAALVAAGGDWEQARWELQQVQKMQDAAANAHASTAGSSTAASVPLPTQLARQASAASSGRTALSSHLLAPASEEPFAASWPAAGAPAPATAADGWAAQGPQLAGATSAWQQGVQPAAPASASPASGFDAGYAAGMTAALQGWQHDPTLAAAPAAAAALEPAANAAYGWAGGVPPPQERPPADDAEVDDLMAMLGIA